MADALVVGNNLAALVAAAELGTAGRDVVLVTDGRPPGGHFRGLRIAGTDFDIGMVTLERFPAGGTAGEPDLAGYDPDRRYDWTRFAGAVDRWQLAHADLRRAATPEVLVEGRRWPDHLMSDRLDVLAELGTPPPAVLPRAEPVHAAHKTTGPAYETLTYAAAAEANHGRALQERLVIPFAAKVLGPGLDDLLARYHRAAWLPLYWPETVTAACAGEPTAVAEHPFWTTSSGFVGDLVRELERRIAELPTVTVDPSAVVSLSRAEGGWEVRTESGGRTVHPRPVLGIAAERAAALLGLPPVGRTPGAPVTVLFGTVRAAAVHRPAACLLVADPGLVAYRVTDQDLMAGRDAEWRRVTVEAGHAADAAGRDGDVAGPLVDELCGLLGIDPHRGGSGGHPDVRVLRTLRAPGALGIPTAASVAAARQDRHALLEACPGAVLTGALLGPGLNSLGDQVVQGLAAAARLG
ncbi:hypothetical protein [Trujillonella humicola]|uniref:hypothetical protein n=1 Tax=Trujillonella humicola TaxID=3383699 RepID=UPI003906C0BF